MPDVSTLNVLLYGEPVGTLTHVAGDRTLFAFTDRYVTDRQRPVLSLGFKDAFGELITEFAPTQTKLLSPGFQICFRKATCANIWPSGRA